MDFNNEIKTIGRDIYEKATAFVEANKGLDDAVYLGAILNLNDGRKMYVPFANNYESGKVTLYNYQWNEELQKGSGEEFWISAESSHGFLGSHGFLVSITIFSDKDNLSFTVADDNHQFQEELSEKNKNIIKNYIVQLQEQMSTLEYNKEATCSVQNMTRNARKDYNIQKYNDEVKKMLEADPTSKALPSVQAAVNWWVEKLTASINDKNHSKMFGVLPKYLILQNQINDIQLDRFEDLLSQAIMNELGRGNEAEFSTDDDILRGALEGAEIRIHESSYKPKMQVDVESVRVAESFLDKFEEIFKMSDEEVKHKM